MSKETKPNSRIIQITDTFYQMPLDGKIEVNTRLHALCEDGSIWVFSKYPSENEHIWHCILEAGYDKKEPTALDEFLKQNHFKHDGVKMEFLDE